MVEAQHNLEILLGQMDQAGGLAGLVLGFVLGLLTGLAVFYQSIVRA